MIDDELLHRAIDGETTFEEKRRIEEALSGDPATRVRYEELQRLQGAIDSVPRVEPPPGLVQSVMRAVRTRARAVDRHTPGPRSALGEALGTAFFRRPALGVGLAFASGILLTALAGSLAELGPWPRGGTASATILPGGRLPGAEIHRLSLGREDLKLEAVALSAGDRVLIQIRLEGPGRADLVVGPTQEGVPLVFSRRSGSAESVVLDAEGLHVRGAGAGEYELALSGPAPSESIEVRLGTGETLTSGLLRVRE